MRGFLGIVAVALVSACAQAPAELKADGAWVRLPAVRENPGAAYFTLHGGTEPAVLVQVSARFAVRTELHESMKNMDHGSGHGGATMSMKPIKDVAVPARGEVAFAPGGKHVMLFDVAPELRAGEKAPLTLSFADGKKIEVQAVVVGAGDPEPK
jgi:periplasmic copper chaperone A